MMPAKDTGTKRPRWMLMSASVPPSMTWRAAQ